MPLPMDFTQTLEAFYTPLPVYIDDMTGSYNNDDRPGEWVWAAPVRRANPIAAIVLELSMQELAFYKEGQVSQGGIAVITQERLYYSNIVAGNAEQNIQSLVTYQDEVFRVVGDGYTTGYDSLIGNSNFHVYHCLRFIQ